MSSIPKRLAQTYLIDAFTGMAQGLFVTLILGLILSQVGAWLGLGFLKDLGRFAGMLMGAGVGVGIMYHLKAPPLVVLSGLVVGLMGANAQAVATGSLFVSHDGGLMIKAVAGNPICAYLTAVFAHGVGAWLHGKTRLDLLIVPSVMALVAYAVCVFLCPPVVAVVDMVGAGIIHATELNPLIMGVVVSVVVGLLLTLPTSSAALCIAIGLGGLAGGAGVVGGASHMVGFAVASYKDNGVSGLISQGVGTSMLQLPNIIKKPIILLPAVIASIITGALATTVFQIHCTPTGSGMGTSGLVGVFGVIDANPAMPTHELWLAIILLMFVLPAVIAWVVAFWLRKMGKITDGDMKLP